MRRPSSDGKTSAKVINQQPSVFVPSQTASCQGDIFPEFVCSDKSKDSCDFSACEEFSHSMIEDEYCSSSASYSHCSCPCGPTTAAGPRQSNDSCSKDSSSSSSSSSSVSSSLSSSATQLTRSSGDGPATAFGKCHAPPLRDGRRRLLPTKGKALVVYPPDRRHLNCYRIDRSLSFASTACTTTGSNNNKKTLTTSPSAAETCTVGDSSGLDTFKSLRRERLLTATTATTAAPTSSIPWPRDDDSDMTHMWQIFTTIFFTLGALYLVYNTLFPNAWKSKAVSPTTSYDLIFSKHAQGAQLELFTHQCLRFPKEEFSGFSFVTSVSAAGGVEDGLALDYYHYLQHGAAFRLDPRKQLFRKQQRRNLASHFSVYYSQRSRLTAMPLYEMLFGQKQSNGSSGGGFSSSSTVKRNTSTSSSSSICGLVASFFVGAFLGMASLTSLARLKRRTTQGDTNTTTTQQQQHQYNNNNTSERHRHNKHSLILRGRHQQQHYCN